MFVDYVQTPIGLLKITADEKFIYSVEETKTIGDINSNKIITNLKQELAEYFSGRRKIFDTPIKLVGSEFQLSVWEALRTIPYGELVSYKDIAIKIKNEKAAIAVGSANNKNKLLIIVPCHRVIGSNKKLVGFRLGLETKQYLIDLEKNHKM